MIKLNDKRASCVQLRTIYYQLNKKELQNFEEKH